MVTCAQGRREVDGCPLTQDEQECEGGTIHVLEPRQVDFDFPNIGVIDDGINLPAKTLGLSEIELILQVDDGYIAVDQ
jgi:hypothetical protein